MWACQRWVTDLVTNRRERSPVPDVAVLPRFLSATSSCSFSSASGSSRRHASAAPSRRPATRHRTSFLGHRFIGREARRVGARLHVHASLTTAGPGPRARRGTHPQSADLAGAHEDCTHLLKQQSRVERGPSFKFQVGLVTPKSASTSPRQPSHILIRHERGRQPSLPVSGGCHYGTTAFVAVVVP